VALELGLLAAPAGGVRVVTRDRDEAGLRRHRVLPQGRGDPVAVQARKTDGTPTSTGRSRARPPTPSAAAGSSRKKKTATRLADSGQTGAPGKERRSRPASSVSAAHAGRRRHNLTALAWAQPPWRLPVRAQRKTPEAYPPPGRDTASDIRSRWRRRGRPTPR
jgi:hypothetical protein